MTKTNKPGSHASRHFKPYPDYKDSGVEWLGRIPVHWETARLKYAAQLNPKPSETKDLDPQTEVSFVPMEAVGAFGGMDASRTRPLADVRAGYTYFRTDDLVVASITPCFENGKGARASGLVNGIAFGTTELQVLRASPSVDAGFLFYFTLSDAFRRLGTADMYGAGGQKRVPESFIRDVRFPRMPVQEQCLIAAFLDRETAKIDQLISKNEQLVRLLNQDRSALIARAVMRGFDPARPTRDSGVGWLGEVPQHWRVDRIKWVARMESGHTPDKKIDSYWVGGDVPWVSLADTAQLREVDYIAETAVMTTRDGLAHSSAHILPAGTVVFSRDASIGLCAITRTEMAVSQHFIGWVCGPEVRPEYLLFVLRSMTEELERLTMGATVRTIGMPDVKSLVMPIPPVHEQDQMVSHILARRQRIDEMIGRVSAAIDHLTELRSALISSAVTGQIDVRQETA